MLSNCYHCNSVCSCQWFGILKAFKAINSFTLWCMPLKKLNIMYPMICYFVNILQCLQREETILEFTLSRQVSCLCKLLNKNKKVKFILMFFGICHHHVSNL